MDRPILNLADVTLEPLHDATTSRAPERFSGWMGEIGLRLGTKKLGYNLTVLPPGKCAFPRHSHRVNEEMFFVIEGDGEIRIGAMTYPIRAGDVIACPPGGPESAHQIANTGAGPLRYLAVSTLLWPEIVDYPDSGKFGVRAELEPGPGGRPTMFRFNGRYEDGLDYWDGE